GRLDVATGPNFVGPNTPLKIAVLLGRGDGTFQEKVQLPVGLSTNYLVTADFNGDGRPDLAIGDGISRGITLFFGRGDGTFQGPTLLSVPGEALAAADLNRDGRTDLAVVNLDVQVFLGRGDGTFQQEGSPAGGSPTALVTGDFNADGLLDV